MLSLSPCLHVKSRVHGWRWLKDKRLELKGLILWSWLFTLDLSHFWTQISLCLSLSAFSFWRSLANSFSSFTNFISFTGLSLCSSQNQIKQCYGLNVFISPRFMCWNYKSQCDDIWRGWLWKAIRSWGWSPHEWNSALTKGTPKSLLPSFHYVWNKKSAACNWEKRSHRTMLVPWSWMHSFQNCEK